MSLRTKRPHPELPVPLLQAERMTQGSHEVGIIGYTAEPFTLALGTLEGDVNCHWLKPVSLVCGINHLMIACTAAVPKMEIAAPRIIAHASTLAIFSAST